MSRSYRSQSRLVGRQRANAHKGSKNKRLFDDPAEEHSIGAAGELAFAELVNTEIDRSTRPDGDGGIDFIVPFWITVDVKTFRKPYNLLVKANEINRPVDIYVLAEYKEDTGEVFFLGWMRKLDVKGYPIKDHGHNMPSHTVPVNDLHPMEALLTRIKRENLERRGK